MPAQPVSLVTGLKPVNPSIPCFKESDKKEQGKRTKTLQILTWSGFPLSRE
jgi:hypothetical protein